jgi:hypothetical protein
MSLSPGEKDREERARDAARAALSEKAVTRAYAAGRAMTPEQALAFARNAGPKL